MECKFCKNTFNNKSSLNKHQKQAKYCLKLQDKEVKNSFISKKELLNDNKLKDELIKDMKFRLEKQNEKYSSLINKLNTELKELKEEYELKLKEQKEEYEVKIEKLQDRLENLATRAIEKPTQQVVKTTNNTTNNVLNLTPLNLDKENFKEKIEEGYDIQYFLKGTRGVAEFTKDKLLVDDEGKSRYICVDPARQIFKYVDENGETHRDVKANKLTKKVAPDILNKANKIVVEERENKENYKCTIDKITDIFFIINDLKDNPDKLAVELSKIVCD